MEKRLPYQTEGKDESNLKPSIKQKWIFIWIKYMVEREARFQKLLVF